MIEPLRLCGLGVRVPEETTLDALLALDECRVAFVHGISPEARAWLAGHVAGLRDAASAKAVVAELRGGGPVGLAVWGHPEFTSPFAREVQRACRAAALPFTVRGAVSPMGSAFARAVNFLGGDYGYQGIQSYPLDALLREPARWTPRLPLVAYHDAPAARSWTRLSSLLLRALPSRHPVRVYPAGGGEGSIVELRRLGDSVPGAAVVLVPPAGGEPSSPAKRAG